MNILYRSTRGAERGVAPSAALLKGLASDGGLYVPEQLPRFDIPLSRLASMNYKEIAYEVMSRFLTDYTEEELKHCIDCAYDSKFDTEEIAHLREADGSWFLELFHGATIAFKDMALSILPHLMTTAAKKNHVENEIVILTATSGDTGKAALAGFADVPGTKIIVFYPKDGVSHVQERQMVTQKGDNTFVVAIKGNFDDAQTGVKKIFGNTKLSCEMNQAGCQFSSANSINIGRLVPQVAYYVYAYAALLHMGKIQEGQLINVVVPTGNFGNILAAYYAKQMGMPFDKLICASNENKVLYDFFGTGCYDKNREFILTSSPSMDILVSSNLERLIFQITGENPDKTKALMTSLSSTGKYEITKEMRDGLADFVGGFASEEQVFETIGRIYRNDDYVIDPHTGVAATVADAYKDATGDDKVTVIASTASPYKFARSVLHAIDTKYDSLTDMEQIDALNNIAKVAVPKAIEEIRTAFVRHNTVVEADKMEAAVRNILGLDK